MSRKTGGSLTRQVEQNLKSKLKIGCSKQEAQQIRLEDGRRESDRWIYSWSTYNNYLSRCLLFVGYCRTREPRPRTLEECEQYAPEWIRELTAQGKSPYTVKQYAAALAKLYGHGSRNFGVELPRRSTQNVTRSRGPKERDRHFSESNPANVALRTFCQRTGLRRSELANLRGEDLTEHGGKWFIHVRSGKGGRERYAQIAGTDPEVMEVVQRMEQTAPGAKVWPRVHNAADVHAWRADYAQALYNQYARPVEQIRPSNYCNGRTDSEGRYHPAPEPVPSKDGKLRRSECYICRGAKRGKVYDREALAIASRNLGHSRINVVAEHYLRD